MDDPRTTPAADSHADGTELARLEEVLAAGRCPSTDDLDRVVALPLPAATFQSLAGKAMGAAREQAAVRLTVAAARRMCVRGERRQARSILEDVESRLSQVSTREGIYLARALAECGARSEAAVRFARVAEETRCSGRLERTLELCREGASLDRRVADLHRPWALALLELDDPCSAWGHVERWLERDPADAEPWIWKVEILHSLGRAADAQRALGRLLRLWGLDPADTPGVEGMLQGHVAQDQVARGRDDGFWKDGSFLAGAKGPTLRDAGTPSTDLSGTDVLIVRDQEPADWAVATLREVGATVELATWTDLPDALERLRPSIVLACLDVASQIAPRHGDFEKLAGLGIPVLVVSGVPVSTSLLSPLRSLGVGGVVQAPATADHLVFRIAGMVRRGAQNRRWERVGVRMPVRLEANELATEEIATSLSAGGVGILSRRPLEPNTDVRIDLALPRRRLSARGRVVYLHAEAGPDAACRLGIFFYPLPADDTAALHEAVRLLAAEAR